MFAPDFTSATCVNDDGQGLDPSEKMLDVARRVDKKSVFVQGNVSDMSSIQDGTFDVVTTVYTLRNFPDMESGLSEMVRAYAGGIIQNCMRHDS